MDSRVARLGRVVSEHRAQMMWRRNSMIWAAWPVMLVMSPLLGLPAALSQGQWRAALMTVGFVTVGALLIGGAAFVFKQIQDRRGVTVYEHGFVQRRALFGERVFDFVNIRRVELLTYGGVPQGVRFALAIGGEVELHHYENPEQLAAMLRSGSASSTAPSVQQHGWSPSW